MPNRAIPLIEEISTRTQGLASHLATLAKIVEEEESESDQAHESLGHLKICVNSLESVLQTEALRSVPILDLTELNKYLSNVANTLPPMEQSMASGLANFTNQIDVLHRKLWTMRLIDPVAAEDVFMKSAGKLDSALEIAKKHIRELETGLTVREELGVVAQEMDALKTTTEKEVEEISKILVTVQTNEKNILAHEESTTSNASQVEQILTKMKTSEEEFRKIETELTSWHEEIETKRKEIGDLRDSTTKKLTTYDTDITERQESLDDVKKRIEAQFQLVSSGALAKAFGDRGTKLLWSTNLWGVFAVLAYIFAIGFAFWIAGSAIPESTPNEPVSLLNWQYFLIRLTVGVPIAFFVWFATVQYSKAKRIQEAYAFKGTVAASFDAYRKLVEAISKDPELKGNPEFARFITSTISDLYKAPQQDNEDEDKPPHTKGLKEFGTLLKQIESLASKLK